jgi:undecaprenyl diphosphate synthase
MSESSNARPKHVGIIMDGNGRWAEKKALGRISGHRRGTENVRSAIEFAREAGIQSLSLYAFSTENWKRPPEEVGSVMELAAEFLARETAEMKANGVRLRFIGERSRLPERTRRSIEESERETENCMGLNAIIALNYGGRAEIARAARLLSEKVRDGEMEAGDVTEEAFAKCLYCPEAGDLDLLIRTGAEARVSNFLLWQLAYAEIWLTDILWPDFGKAAFQQALDFFSSRQRRFGGLR